MLKRILICDRCGKVIESEHPDRITISRHKYETTKDYKGIEHTHSVYKTSKSMHLCSECEIKFNEFWGNKND
jgi:Fe2+ or Zn2+ uptake regulation protein